jgi:predicted nucleic acid-binding protein
MPTATAGFTAVLVDTSLWVHQLRKGGDRAKRDQVNALLRSGLAAWCPPVRLELWRGVGNEAERKTLRQYEALLPDYEITPPVWERAIQLADRGRAAGVTVPLADLLVFACATLHGLELAHDDSHFERLSQLEPGPARYPGSRSEESL